MLPFLLRSFEYVTPLSTLTGLSGKLTNAKLGSFTEYMIRKFIAAYNINLEECANPDPAAYATFNDFFIRELKKEARPLDKVCDAVSPVDGCVGQAGKISSGRLIQAKGLDYSLKALLGGTQEDEDPFKDGIFCCTYLSPANYHRIHMPLDGRLVKTVHIPGRHFPVGRRNVSAMPDLFTVNERLVCVFETSAGLFALVMVGAAMVGSIGTVWGGTVVRRSGIERISFDDRELFFKRGDEIGHFKFGSTVICVWPESVGQLNELMVHGQAVKMGQAMIGKADPDFRPYSAQKQAELPLKE